MKLFDATARLMTVGMRRNFPIDRPNRILIANAGHLGDLIMTSAILPVLRSAFPTVEIGVLTGSWGRPSVDRHPEVAWVHEFDHLLLNRSGDSRRDKLMRHFRTRRCAYREIRAVGYDVAIDVRFNPGNYLQFLRKCRIPARIGYTSGGSGPFSTHAIDMDERHLHVTSRFFNLLAPLGVRDSARDLMRTSMPPIPEGERLLEGPYAVLHPGTYDVFKQWPTESWRLLAKRLNSEGIALALTGTGEEQKRLAEEIRLAVPSAVNLVGALGWWDYVRAIEQAQLVVCVDTVAQHIAAAVGTPVVALMPGMIGYQWSPFGSRAAGLTDALDCVPCHLSSGCAGMECIRNLDAQRVHLAARELIGR